MIDEIKSAIEQQKYNEPTNVSSTNIRNATTYLYKNSIFEKSISLKYKEYLKENIIKLLNK